MLKAPIPENEEKRLNELLKLRLLDTESEKLFDTFINLAAFIAKAPIALFSLVDSDRQWFKARHGLAADQTPRDISYCGHAIVGNGPFEVPDATLDPRFSDNPLCTSAPWVRYYYGVPVSGPNGAKIGTLCVIDNKPRILTQEQKTSLSLLATAMEEALVIRAKNIKAEDECQFLASLLTTLQEGVVVQDSTGKIIRYNPAALEILSLSSEQITGRTSTDPTWQAIRPDGRPFPGEEHPAMVTLRSGQASRNTRMGVKSGKELKWISINAKPFRTDDNQAVLTTFADITQQVKLEEYLVDSAKADTANKLAAGLAHEINNPLTIALLILESLKQQVSPSEKDLLANLARQERALFRVSQVVKQLAALGSNQPEEIALETISLATTIRAAVGRLGQETSLVPVSIEVSDDDFAYGIQSAFEFTLQSLLKNAFESVSGKPLAWVKITAIQNYNETQITVSDSGTPLSSSRKKQLFEPFFTTKHPGLAKGNSLCLARQALRSFGGRLEYIDDSDHAAFAIFLPRSQRIAKNAA